MSSVINRLLSSDLLKLNFVSNHLLFIYLTIIVEVLVILIDKKNSNRSVEARTAVGNACNIILCWGTGIALEQSGACHAFSLKKKEEEKVHRRNHDTFSPSVYITVAFLTVIGF